MCKNPDYIFSLCQKKLKKKYKIKNRINYETKKLIKKFMH